jgi:hypothetical protein
VTIAAGINSCYWHYALLIVMIGIVSVVAGMNSHDRQYCGGYCCYSWLPLLMGERLFMAVAINRRAPIHGCCY